MVYGYAGKEDLSKGYCNSKTKLGLTMHFSEIIIIIIIKYLYRIEACILKNRIQKMLQMVIFFKQCGFGVCLFGCSLANTVLADSFVLAVYKLSDI